MVNLSYWNQDKTNLWVKVPSIPANDSVTLTATKSTIVDDDLSTEISGLVSYYKFAGNANDSYGSNNGTVSSATLATDQYGRADNCYSFDGVSDYITLPQAVNTDAWNNKRLSVSCWFKSSGTANYEYIAVLGNANWALRIGKTPGDYELIWFVTGTSADVASAGAGYRDGKWHHVVGTYDGTNQKIYVDGVFKGTDAATMTYVAGTANTISFNSATQAMAGLIDNFRIYSKALSDAEVLTIYNSEKIQKGNGDNTFEFFDDFEGSTLDTTNKWKFFNWVGSTSVTPTILNSEIYWKAAASTATALLTKSAFTEPCIIEYRHKTAYTTQGQYQFGYDLSDTTLATNTRYSVYSTGSPGSYLNRKIVSGATTTYETITRAQPTSYKIFKDVMTGNAFYHYEDNTQINTVTTEDNMSGNMYYWIDSYNDRNTTYIDWFFRRKYNSTEPTISVTGSNPYTVTITNPTATALTDYQVPITLSSLGSATDYYIYDFEITEGEEPEPSITSDALMHGHEF
jgi:hypothetical protein